MDYETYRQNYFVDPPPKQRFSFAGIFGISLLFEAYEEALNYYSQVFGPPAYVEGDFTRGWQLGETWLTLFPTDAGNPQNMDVQFVMDSLEEAQALADAFGDAGGMVEEPADVLMYEPVRIFPINDPFGTNILVIGRL